MDFPIAGPNVNPCNMVYWTYHLTYIYIYTVYIYICYVLYGHSPEFGSSTNNLALESFESSERWWFFPPCWQSWNSRVQDGHRPKSERSSTFFWVWDDFRGIFGFRFVSHLFSSFSQVNSNFAAELFCSKPSVEKIDSWNPPVEMVGSPTVDGSEIWRSPPAMYKTLWIMGQTTYQLVQNVFHQYYCTTIDHYSPIRPDSNFCQSNFPPHVFRFS